MPLCAKLKKGKRCGSAMPKQTPKLSRIEKDLLKAIEVILDELKTKEGKIPPVPPFPIRVK